ncbi:MAG TPA: ATP-binding cassette domain-containing protein [Anaeromyxobacteraceae bacterium]|nr:ATP-binding cassette domain-containing protein [Anaeromyxobacteraceae bacterium]
MTLLRVDNLSRRFGRLQAVQDISLSVQRGELRAIIGPNGAGKTTFFNMVSGLIPPTSGRILLDGRDVTDLPAHRRVALGVGRTFQVTEIFPELSVRDNLRIASEVTAGYGRRLWMRRDDEAEIRARVDELLEWGRLVCHADRLVGELSHGDQRSTEIMMSIALSPQLLLLD